jgi:hypothetical protein
LAFDTSGDFAKRLAAVTFKPENKEFQANRAHAPGHPPPTDDRFLLRREELDDEIARAACARPVSPDRNGEAAHRERLISFWVPNLVVSATWEAAVFIPTAANHVGRCQADRQWTVALIVQRIIASPRESHCIDRPRLRSFRQPTGGLS